MTLNKGAGIPKSEGEKLLSAIVIFQKREEKLGPGADGDPCYVYILLLDNGDISFPKCYHNLQHYNVYYHFVCYYECKTLQSLFNTIPFSFRFDWSYYEINSTIKSSYEGIIFISYAIVNFSYLLFARYRFYFEYHINIFYPRLLSQAKLRLRKNFSQLWNNSTFTPLQNFIYNVFHYYPLSVIILIICK